MAIARREAQAGGHSMLGLERLDVDLERSESTLHDLSATIIRRQEREEFERIWQDVLLDAIEKESGSVFRSESGNVLERERRREREIEKVQANVSGSGSEFAIHVLTRVRGMRDGGVIAVGSVTWIAKESVGELSEREAGKAHEKEEFPQVLERVGVVLGSESEVGGGCVLNDAHSLKERENFVTVRGAIDDEVKLREVRGE